MDLHGLVVVIVGVGLVTAVTKCTFDTRDDIVSQAKNPDRAYQNQPIKNGPLEGCVILRQKVATGESSYDKELWITRCPNSTTSVESREGKTNTTNSTIQK